MATKQSVTVQIAGQRLHIRTDRDGAYLQRLAAHADGVINELQRGARHPTPQVLLLALLRVVDELYEARARTDALKEVVRERTATLIELLDSADANPSSP